MIVSYVAATMNSGSLTDLRDRDVDDTAVFYRSGKSQETELSQGWWGAWFG